MSRTLKIIIAAIIAIVLTVGLLYVKLKKEQEASPVNTNIEIPVGPEDASMEEQKILESLSAPATEQATANAQESITQETAQPVVDEQKIIESLSAPVK